TAGSIALSKDLSSPPAGAKWWWKDRIMIVCTKHLAVHFACDALTRKLVWEDGLLWPGDQSLDGKLGSAILTNLFASSPRFMQLVEHFSTLAALEDEYRFLTQLREEFLSESPGTETQREAELSQDRLAALGARQRRSEAGADSLPQASKNGALRASWDSLVIPPSLRENLKAYCRILRDFQAYQSVGVHLPKGLLLHGPPGCGKTKLAKALGAEAGLFFKPLSTSDCKQMYIGWSADRLAKVFTQAREKQPSLIFIDELDAVCPPRGAYHDCVSQEFTAQLLQE